MCSCFYDNILYVFIFIDQRQVLLQLNELVVDWEWVESQTLKVESYYMFSVAEVHKNIFCFSDLIS